MKKIGIFGGTFNPVHMGHIIVAEEVKKGFDLDQICFIPASIPPHKKKKKVARASDRLEMIKLAISDYEDFTVSDIELKRSGPSYTIDTLNHFKKAFSEETRFYFMVGMDAFLDIDTWKSFRKLFDVTPFVVMSRPGVIDGKGEEKIKILKNILVSKVSPDYRFNASQNAFFDPEKKPVYLFDVTPVDISATMIRRKISEGESIDSLVPVKVKEFIESKGLYL